MNTPARLTALFAAPECTVPYSLPAVIRPACNTPDSFSPPARAFRAGILLSLLFAHFLAGCGSGSDSSSASPTPDPLSPPVAAATKHGHYRGLATIDGQPYHAEALLTVDGEFRLFVGSTVGANDGPTSGAGLSGRLLNPETSMQVSALLTLAGREGWGAGLVIGELCATPDAGRFCGESAFAEVSLKGLVDGRMAGEIRTATRASDETWLLDLSAWSSYYNAPARTEHIGSPFSEKLALFARGDSVLISFDDAGRMFFQAPASGCIGNGVLTPHLDGEFFVFDVDLVIENCSAAYDMLNNRFTGLATQTQNAYWNYDVWLAVFLSTPEETESPLALTMYAEAQPAWWDY